MVTIPTKSPLRFTTGNTFLRVPETTSVTLRKESSGLKLGKSISITARTDNSLNTFGDLTALTNGCRLFYEDENGEINIGTTLQTNFDLIRLCVGNPAFGSRSTAGGATFNPFFLPDAVGATADAIIPVLNFNTIFGFTYGLRLKNGTNNRLVFEIADDLSAGLDAFNIIAYGFKRKIK
jgi:hypothetical protein